MIHDAQEPALRGDFEPPSIRDAVERDGCLACSDDDGAGGRARARRQPKLRGEHERACRELRHHPSRVHGSERGGGEHRDRAPSLSKKDAHLLRGRAADLGTRVVVREDLVVRPPLLGLTEGAVLAHAHAMTPPATGDGEHRLTRNAVRRRHGLRRRGGHGKSESKAESGEKAHEKAVRVARRR